MFIKVCGITDENQAKEIANYGATHIGVVYFPHSKRHVNFEKIKSIKKVIPQNTKLTVVVVNPKKEEIHKLFEVADVIQFHGDEDIEFLKSFPKEKIIKAFRLKDGKSIEKIKPFLDEGFQILIDAYSNKEYGGTGKQIEEKIIEKVKVLTDNFILSGGLSENNVYDLIKKYKPFGVDASSKLEVRPGIKDLDKVYKFIKNSKKAFEELNIE